MHRLIRRFSLPALAGIAVVSTAWHQGAKSANQDVTITGAVVDLACYFGKGDSGPSHQQCADIPPGRHQGLGALRHRAVPQQLFGW